PNEPPKAFFARATHPIVRTGLVVLEKLGRGYTALFGALALIGLARWWRLYFRPDHLALVLFSLATLAAIWIHAAAAWMSSTRYVLPLVILATPMAALGLFPVCRGMARLAAWLAPRAPVAPYAAAVSVFILVLTV